jgi:hypothetical protein
VAKIPVAKVGGLHNNFMRAYYTFKNESRKLHDNKTCMKPRGSLGCTRVVRYRPR